MRPRAAADRARSPSAVAGPAPAQGHPLGNFTINHYAAIRVEPKEVEIRYVVDMAEIPTFQEIQGQGLAADRGHPATVAYLLRTTEGLGRGLRVEVNGSRRALSTTVARGGLHPGRRATCPR